MDGVARDVGCEAELDGIRRVFERGGGAGRQRAAHAIGGMRALLREVGALTAAGLADGARPPALRA